jgi:hypothetical protein
VLLGAKRLELCLAVLVGARPLPAAEDPQPAPAVVLDVPYVGQTEALCGGAAVAMIFRYWGRTGIYAEDFAALVEEDEAGIRTSVLATEVRRRGWQAVAFSGTASEVRRLLQQGRPLLALIEDRPGRYHYVVLTGFVGDDILFHDPARAPFRSLEEEPFYRAWAKAAYWSLLILPGVEEERDGTDLDAVASPAPAPAGECDALVAEGVRLAREGESPQARSLLNASAGLCPEASGPPRELAGIHLLRNEVAEAERLAERAVRLDPEDEHAWRLLGTSRFLQEDFEGALSAFNRIGEPRVDLIRVRGLERTNQKVVLEFLEMAPRSLLTEAGLRRARRRLEELPVALSSRLSFTPQPDGSAVVDAAVQERPLFLSDRFDLVARGLHALSEREVALRLASPTHGGELWSLDWRWWEGRPRVGLSLAAPRPPRFGSVWRMDASWEEESYRVSAIDALEAAVRERRERVSLSFQDWTARDLLWEIGAGVDRWSDRGVHLSFGGALEKRWASDRMGLRAEASGWTPVENGPFFASGGLRWSWRSSARAVPTIWKARAGIDAVSENAPRMVWPGAGVGHARSVLLRAHPLLEEGAIDSEIFGRHLGHGGVELERWLPTRLPMRVALVAFADLARASGVLSSNGGTGRVDVGGGVRVALPGQSSVLRIDVARGLLDRSFAVSLGWQREWPAWD